MSASAAGGARASETATALAAVGVDPAEVPARVQAMWLAYVRGTTLAAVAREFGVSASRVSLLFGECALPTGRVAREAVLRVIGSGAGASRAAAEAQSLAEAGAAAARLREIWLLYARCGVTAEELARRYALPADRLRAAFRSIEERGRRAQA